MAVRWKCWSEVGFVESFSSNTCTDVCLYPLIRHRGGKTLLYGSVALKYKCLMIAWSFSTFVDWMQVVVATMSLPECARPSTSGQPRRLQGDFKACLVGGDLSVTDGLLDLCLSFCIYSWTQSVWTNSCITTRLWSVALQWNRCPADSKKSS